MPDMKLTEAEIKAKVISELRTQAVVSTTSIIANEYRVGYSSLRADLAILADCFIGIEIKSELDSLRRLSAQTKTYLSYFDRTIVVLASRHFKSLDLRTLTGAEVWEIDSDGKFNIFPSFPTVPLKKSPRTDLLTQYERKRYWQTHAEPDFLLGNASEEQIADAAFREAFRKKFKQTSSDFWRAVSGRIIKTAHLSRLSRFHESRQGRLKLSEMQNNVWKDWQLKAERALTSSITD